MGQWLMTQIAQAKKRSFIMKSDEIYNKWTSFIQEYNEYFINNNNVKPKKSKEEIIVKAKKKPAKNIEK